MIRHSVTFDSFLAAALHFKTVANAIQVLLFFQDKLVCLFEWANHRNEDSDVKYYFCI